MPTRLRKTDGTYIEADDVAGETANPSGAYIFGETYDFIRDHPSYQGPTVVVGANDTTGKGAKFALTSDSNDANTPEFASYSSRGSLAEPEASTNGNPLLNINAYGFDGSDFQGSSIIEMGVAASPTAGHVPGKLGFYVEDGASLVSMLDLNGATKVAKITGANGVVQSAPAASTAALLGNGQVSFYLDEATHKLKVAVKYSNGTTKTGEVSLS